MKYVMLLLMLLVLSACGTSPRPINYGVDACSFCQMTIVDRQHAAQIVTVKGKSYKYDAIECMMNDLKTWDRPAVAHFLVSDYANPGELTDAITAHYLISEEIPSPMGAFLTAFARKDKRASVNETGVGEELEWNVLKSRFELNHE